VAIVEVLNEIGARNAIGRVDLVENRFVGIKSRGCYETPGGTLLLTAHRELEALCLDRDLSHFKQHVGLKYAEIVYFGLWFTLLRESLEAFVESTHLNPDAPVKVGAWMVVIIVGRELAITGLRLLAASKNIVLAAERYGKHKTISQIVTIIALLVVDACEEWPVALRDFFAPWVPQFAEIMLWLTVVLTAMSGLIYLWRNRALYLEDV